MVGDETGIAHLRLVGDQFSELKVDDVIALRNTRVNVIKNYLRLEIDVWGKIT